MSIEGMETLGEIIKKAIKERGLKESFIAEKMGVSRQSLNQIETRKTFDLEWLQKFKAASGIDFTQYAPPSIDKINTPYNSELEYNGSMVNDDQVAYESNKVEMFLNFKISTTSEDFQNMIALINKIKSEAKNMGFTIS
jgi:transcriptional regulator with XRE-family HTH domain